MLEVPLKSLTELGFTIACGVLLETFVVRSVLVFNIGARLVAGRWPGAGRFRNHRCRDRCSAHARGL